MGYAVSVKFKSEAETQRMLNFLELPEVKSMLDAGLQETYPPRKLEWISFNTGESLSAYAPQTHAAKRISTKDTTIPYSYYQLYAWMAIKSEHKDKYGRPVIWYDDEASPLVNIDNMSKEEINNCFEMKMKDGFYWRDMDQESVFFPLGVMKELFTKEKQSFNSFQEVMVKIDKRFEEYVLENPLEVKAKRKNKM